MKPTDDIKLFHISNSLLDAELKQIEDVYGIDLGRPSPATEGHDDSYYPQFGALLRAEAARMARHYELFYCLENSIREVVAEKLFAVHGPDWWEIAVSPTVKENVQRNIQREREAGVTLRSEDPIDYTTFGELSDIIQTNWNDFADIFNNRKAVVKILAGLNVLRGPIAHCSPLAEDEVLRLGITLRDWFRVME